MTKLYAALLATASLAAGLASCKKETAITGVNITATNFVSLTDALDKAQVQAQTYNVNAALGLQFRGPQGCRFVFPPNAFVTPTGTAVTGTVQVAVREILSPSDAIFSRILLVSGGQSMISGGIIWAFATQNGKTVLLRDGAPYSVFIPQRFGAQAFPGLGYYVGRAVDSSGAVSDVDFISDAGGTVNNLADTVVITTDTFTHVAAGFPVSFLDTDTFSIAVTGPTIGGQQAAVYTLQRGANTVFPVKELVGARANKVIRAEAETHVVGVAVVDGRFYAGITTVTKTKSNDTYTVSLAETTPGEFKKKIDALP